MRETELWANGGLCSEAPRAANLQVGRSYRPIQTCNEARPRRGCPRLARFRRATNFVADSELSERSWSVHELFLAHTVTCCVRPSQLDRSRKQRVAQPSMHAHAIMRVQCTACYARRARHGAQGTARKRIPSATSSPFFAARTFSWACRPTCCPPTRRLDEPSAGPFPRRSRAVCNPE